MERGPTVEFAFVAQKVAQPFGQRPAERLVEVQHARQDEAGGGMVGLCAGLEIDPMDHRVLLEDNHFRRIELGDGVVPAAQHGEAEGARVARDFRARDDHLQPGLKLDFLNPPADFDDGAEDPLANARVGFGQAGGERAEESRIGGFAHSPGCRRAELGVGVGQHLDHALGGGEVATTVQAQCPIAGHAIVGVLDR